MPTTRRESTSAWSPTPPITCAASGRKRNAGGAALERLRGFRAGRAQGHALWLRHHPAVRGPAFIKEAERAIRQLGPQRHLHPFKPQGALSRRRRSASVLELVEDLDVPVMIHPPHLGFGEERMKEYRLAPASAVRSIFAWRSPANRARILEDFRASRSWPRMAVAASARPSAAWITPTNCRTRRFPRPL